MAFSLARLSIQPWISRNRRHQHASNLRRKVGGSHRYGASRRGKSLRGLNQHSNTNKSSRIKLHTRQPTIIVLRDAILVRLLTYQNLPLQHAQPQAKLDSNQIVAFSQIWSRLGMWALARPCREHQLKNVFISHQPKHQILQPDAIQIEMKQKTILQILMQLSLKKWKNYTRNCRRSPQNWRVYLTDSRQ